MKFNFNVTAKSFATICLVISAAGFFLGNWAVGVGFVLLAVAAFLWTNR